jgi:hypothetical protein
MSWRLSGRSGWATEREGLRLANPGAIVLLGLLGEAGSPVTVVSLPAHGPPCAWKPHPYQAYSRDAFLLVRGRRPAQRSDGSDRGCPLDTGVVRLMWHANGTTSEERPGAWRRCPDS